MATRPFFVCLMVGCISSSKKRACSPYMMLHMPHTMCHDQPGLFAQVVSVIDGGKIRQAYNSMSKLPHPNADMPPFPVPSGSPVWAMKLCCTL